MRVRLPLLVLLLLSHLFASAANPAEPEFKFNKENFYKGRSELAKRKNGVLLQADFSVKDDVIKIQWKLDYTGQRQPLVILKPTLENTTAGQTIVIIYAEGKDGRPYKYELKSPTQIGDGLIISAAFKDWFVTVEKGKSATGVIDVPEGKFRGQFTSTWPDQFNQFVRKPAPVIHIQLRHKPFDRGESPPVPFGQPGADSLDAWTGELFTPVVKVPLAKW